MITRSNDLLMFANALANETMYRERDIVPVPIESEPVWKRRKCKTCKRCGSFCRPDNKYRYSRPSNKACKNYECNKKDR